MADKRQWMMMRVVFRAQDPDAAQDLLSAVFTAHGVSGTVLDAPGETGPVLPGQDAPDKSSGAWAVTGYVPDGEEGRLARSKIEKDIRLLSGSMGFSFEIEASTVEEKEWATAWKAFFHPVRITKRLVVKPTWEPYSPGPGETVIQIDPEMAFGTGAHPTTTLCMQMMETSVRPGDLVLDVGTGSGILMVWAAALGAGAVFGCDNDPLALAVAEKNLRLNGVSRDRAFLFQGELAQAVGGRRVHLVVANVHAQANILLAGALGSVLAPGGCVIASGMLRDQCKQVQEAFAANGLSVRDANELGEWSVVRAGLS